MNRDSLLSKIDKLFPAKDELILISACLIGINCTYDNSNNENNYILQIAKFRQLIPVCPEQLGGLPTPREPQTIIDGNGVDVLNGRTQIKTQNKKNVTQFFLKGAKETGKIIKLFKIKNAILKEKSPSCGVTKIYNNKKLVEGLGVTSAFLKNMGIKIYSEKNIEEALSD
jgi:uncharacterized protein YbbK (DUF523 family)